MNLPLYDMAETGLILVSITFPLSAIIFFASTFFTAFNDGIRSGAIAFFNGFFFLIVFSFIFSRFWGVDGVLIAMPARDAATVLISVAMLWKYRKHYKYA
jgi:Na+-driven multidrug efflux pump